MNKKWYAIYTKADYERKVINLLGKKKIEYYCPINRKVNINADRKKIHNLPLFPAILFVRIAEDQMYDVKRTSDVINFMYWLGHPAIIKENDIQKIEYFTDNYYNLEVHKIIVNHLNDSKIVSESPFSNEHENSMQPPKIKLILPSLGFEIITETENTQIGIFSHLLSDTVSLS